MSTFTTTAIKASREAEKVLSHYFLKRTKAKKVGAEFKAEADKAADTTIYAIIKRKFPSHSILSEERDRKLNLSEYAWVIDPLDGTTNFLCGFPFWAILIGLIHHGQPVMGVINIPQLRLLYVVEKKKGVYRNDQKVRVDAITDLRRSVIALDPGYHSQRRKVISEVIIKLGERVSNLTMINSIGSTFPLIASGNLQALIHYSAKIWELPTAMLLLQEAGGKVTDFKGKTVNFDLTSPRSYKILASNGTIHSKLLKLLS